MIREFDRVPFLGDVIICSKDYSQKTNGLNLSESALLVEQDELLFDPSQKVKLLFSLDILSEEDTLSSFTKNRHVIHLSANFKSVFRSRQRTLFEFQKTKSFQNIFSLYYQQTMFLISLFLKDQILNSNIEDVLFTRLGPELSLKEKKAKALQYFGFKSL